MEGEMMNLIMVCVIVMGSLTYTYFISSRIPTGNIRLISLLPIISIFTLSPLILSSFFLQFYIGYFIGWIANFRLLLFAFGRDETLSIHPSMSLLRFILLSTLPIKINRIKPTPSSPSTHSAHSAHYPKTTLSLNLIIWSVLVQKYLNYKRHTSVTNSIVIHILYTARMFFSIQVSLPSFTAIAQFFLGQELEPQFNNPILSTSLQNFWGKRWNLGSSGVLKSTIHEPVRSLLTPIFGRRGSLHVAILASFLVSGLMHELVYYYVTRRKPTWEVTWYFLIHGVCVVTEIEVKKKASMRGWKLHPFVSTVLAAVFVFLTSVWLCFAEFIHSGEDAREIKEYIALGGYIKRKLYGLV